MNSIYVLVDPRTRELRYVGKTRDPEMRLKAHCYGKHSTYCSRWIQALKRDGFAPQMVIVESGLTEEQWPEREQHWIAHYRELGAELTNITDGGHHVVNTKHSYPAEGCFVYSKQWALALAKNKTLKGSAYSLLLWLIGSMDKQNRYQGRQQYIAKTLGYSTSVICLAVKQLIDIGAVLKVTVNGLSVLEVNRSLASRTTLAEQ